MYRLGVQSLLFHPSRSCQNKKLGHCLNKFDNKLRNLLANTLANTKIVLANLLANKLAKWNLALMLTMDSYLVAD